MADRPIKRKVKRTMSNCMSGYFDDPKTHGRDVQAAEGARQVQSRQKRVSQAIDDATAGKPPKLKSRARAKGATTYEEAKRTKHTGSEGETAYGQRMTESPYGSD